MADLVKKTNEAAYVAVLRRGAAVVIDVLEADRTVRVASPLGTSLPLHASAAGKALLAFDSEDEIRGLVPESLKSFTERTPSDRTAFMQQLRSVASSGVAIDMGEHQDDLRAVAVPIRDYTRNVVGALAVAGPSYRFQAERLDKELGPLVAKAGTELSSRLGFDRSA